VHDGLKGQSGGSWKHVNGGDMGFTTLTDEERRELRRLSKFYWKEARRGEEAKAYLAGCVMLGSALETLLILMIDCHDEEAERTGKAPTLRGQVKPLLDWKLAELLRVAKAAGWLPSALDLGAGWNRRKARIGDYAEVVRMVRNLAHPARYQADHRSKKVTAKYLKQQFDVVLVCRDWLAAHNNEILLKHIQESEKSAEAGAEAAHA
jgi:hypothetical protein